MVTFIFSPKERAYQSGSMNITIHPEVKNAFPDLEVLTRQINGVKVERRNASLEKFREELVEEVKGRYSLETLGSLPTFKAYRAFFWKIGIDPTKNRPAAEALIRRILRGNPPPTINTLVDAYNLASIKTEIALAAFDVDGLKGSLTMRFASQGEEFLGIGMSKPLSLRGGEIVISDSEKLVAIYPYRDAENTKVTEGTGDVLILVCGVPGIPREKLDYAGRVAVEYVVRFCGGRLEE
ncbi:MAG: B3/B4 domain-containing protein [Candidatus Hecatellaceae archaeon]